MITNMVDDPGAPPPSLLEKIIAHGIRVRAAREAAKLTIFELAERTGISVQRLGALEGGRAMPQAEEAEALSRATGIPAELFVE
jgi:transcriptional regulator with XRE-family HTH domain